MPAALIEVITLGRTLNKRAADVIAYFCVSSSDLAPPVVTNLGPRQTQCMTIAEGDQHGEETAGALIAEARQRVRPLDLAARRLAEGGFAADLIADDGRIAQRDYGVGPSELLATLAAEQRYLAEQEGGGTVRGATYLDKARERVRRGPAPVD